MNSIINCPPFVLAHIIDLSRNSSTMLMSKKFFSCFNRALQKVWDHFLEEEKKTNGKYSDYLQLETIEKKYAYLKFELSATSACIPALRKFKAFFDSPSMEMIEQVMKRHSYKNLHILRFAYHQSIQNIASYLFGHSEIVETLKKLDSTFVRTIQTYNKITMEESRGLFKLLKKDQETTQAIRGLPAYAHYAKMLPSELFITFNKIYKLDLDTFASFPKEISLCKNLQILHFKEKNEPIFRPEIINLPSLRVVRGQIGAQLYPFMHHHHILTTMSAPIYFKNSFIIELSGNALKKEDRLEIRGEWYHGKEGKRVVLKNISWEKGLSFTPFRERKTCISGSLEKVFSKVTPSWFSRDSGDVIDTQGYFFKFKICKITGQNEVIWEKGDERVLYATSLFCSVGRKHNPIMMPEFD